MHYIMVMLSYQHGQDTFGAQEVCTGLKLEIHRNHFKELIIIEFKPGDCNICQKNTCHIEDLEVIEKAAQ